MLLTKRIPFVLIQVWVFTIKEGPPASKNAFKNFLDAVSRAGAGGGFGLGLSGDGGPREGGGAGGGGSRQRRLPPQRENRVFTDIFKFINAGSGVTGIKLHPDGKRMAVLLPLNQTVEVRALVHTIAGTLE